MAQKHPTVLYFLLRLKIAVILSSRRTRFDVRFFDLAVFPFIAVRWRDGTLLPRRQESPTTAALKAAVNASVLAKPLHTNAATYKLSWLQRVLAGKCHL